MLEFQGLDGDDFGSMQLIFEVKLSETEIENINIDPTELKSSRFVSMGEFENLAVPRLSLRISFSKVAVNSGETLYLENGEPT